MTGLIYLAIIAMWVAVLVPMWLRRHDHQNESRNVDRFNSAMRTLSRSRRRAPYADTREVLQPRRDRRIEVSVAGAEVAPRPDRRSAPSPERAAAVARAVAARTATTEPPAPAARREARRVAAARRRRVLLVVSALLVLTGAAVLAGLLPRWSLLLPAAVLVGFLALARRQVRAAEAADRAARRRSGSGRSAAARPYARPATARCGDDTPLPVPAEAEVAVTVDPDAWQPVPTTLPTYVTAPAASHVPRVIDLTHPGAWDSRAMLQQLAAMRQQGAVYDRELDERAEALLAEQEAALAYDAYDAYADLDSYVDPTARAPRRRAVNE